jgi:F-box and WD-40 domain protein 1/11
LVDMTTLQGWSTSPEYQYENNPPSNVDHLPLPFVSATLSSNTGGRLLCQICGSDNVHPAPNRSVTTETHCTHGDLVRSVALGEDFVVSGSYDLSIKVCFFAND